MSTESSGASFSSSSCSSTFSSLDTNNKTAQPEALPRRQINIQSRATKDQHPSPINGVQSHDLRDVVKDSMYREARSLSIKSLSHDERRGTVMKHIDSPRPIGKHSKDERLTLARFSYDGRESREIYKSSMKHKELPRLSLDSKTGAMKALSFLGPLNQEPETHRSSSVVAKLMGLDTFPDTPTMKACPWLSDLTSAPQQINQNQLNSSPSPRKSRFPVEPAPWRQQDSSQGSPKNRKAPTNNPHQTSSVYGEIEKRITELEFKKSGKDLRALKQILEAMQKTRERLEGERGDPTEFTLQRRCSFEDSCSGPNRTTYHQVRSIKGPCTPKQSGNVVIMKAMDKAKPSATSRVEISHLQTLQTRTPKYKYKRSSAHSQKTNDLTPENKKNTSEGYQHTPSRSCGTVSPRLQRSLLRVEAKSNSSDSGRVKKQCGKKNMEKGSLNRKVKVKAKDQQLSDNDQLSELSSYQGDTASVKSESNNSLILQTETEIMSMAHPINTAAPQKQVRK